MNKTDIDHKLRKWYQTVEDSIRKIIPFKTYRTTKNAITSQFLKSIQHEHSAVKNIG